MTPCFGAVLGFTSAHPAHRTDTHSKDAWPMNDFRATHRVDAERLTARCDPSSLPFQSTQDIHPLEAVFGQERAVRAIEFALGMDALGYNLYASGLEGMGKATIVESFLRQRAAELPTPPDWVYVYNFDNPDRPVGITLPPGDGRAFAEAVRRTTHSAADELQRVFDSDTYVRQRQDIGRELDTRRSDILDQLRNEAQQRGFLLQMTPAGITSAPVVEGKPLSDEEFEQLPQQAQERIKEAAHELEQVVADALLGMRALERGAQDRLQRLDDEVATGAISGLLGALLDRWGQNEEIKRFLEGVSSDLIKEHERFRGSAEQPPSSCPTCRRRSRPARRSSSATRSTSL